ncbi:proline-rich receptor-like protein kinase PERK2 [Schistocerca piceifrons]|uniref:proline-rich receptor-like protein kinase PERK2 n=1 Tax=Schistocerca piceifrons TaxID=274613 RepID=UPI001F5F8B56|nr:proline-rich receptor-like protein kinase PERK2 [Schistocerca piceifrons]
MVVEVELEASQLPAPRTRTPPTAPPPGACLRSSPLPVRSAAPDGRLPPLPRSSAVPEPMDAEAAVTPPPPPPPASPAEVVAPPPPPPPSLPSSGARPGQVFRGAFSSPPREQFGVAGGQRVLAVLLSGPQLRRPWVPPPAVRNPTPRRTAPIIKQQQTIASNTSSPIIVKMNDEATLYG